MSGVSGGGWKGDSVRRGVKTGEEEELLLKLFIVDVIEESKGDVQEITPSLRDGPLADGDDDGVALLLKSFSRREMWSVILLTG